MVFIVDIDGDNDTEHFVTVIGYDTPTHQYGFLDTWAPTGIIRWETFQSMGSYQPWSIWGGWSFRLLDLTGEITKWEQLPDTTPYGMDVRCDRKGMQRVLADDFLCTQTGSIDKVIIWGSWKSDIKGTIQKIHLSIHSDDPIGPGGPDPCNMYSKPAQLLWSKDINAPDFTEFLFANIAPGYEYWWQPPNQPTAYGDQKIWKYEIPIDPCSVFIQQGSSTTPIIYWLDAYVQLEPNSPTEAQFGWKTSGELTHRLDDAVWSNNNGTVWNEMHYPTGHPKNPESADLAFTIITGHAEPNEEPNIPTTAKWLQRPDLSTNGLDVTASDPLILADDFECNKSTLITDITVWGSWKYDYLPYGNPNNVSFTLSIHSDIPYPDPCNPYEWSMPGDVLWVRNLMPSEVHIQKEQINEGWYNPYYQEYLPIGDHVCWKYVFHIPEANAFCQKGTPEEPIVYWLDVQAHPFDTTAQFGWKSSINHWNDDAVITAGFEPYIGWWNELRYPFEHPLYYQSIDLAFAIDGNIPCNEDPNLKYKQPPDLTETGVDVRFDRSDGVTRILADDFPCTTKGRITGVKLWGSWLNDIKGNVQKIHLSIHSDVPIGPNNPSYSKPGQLLWQRDVNLIDINETLEYILPQGQYEWWWDPYIPVAIPLGDTQVWRYDIHIPWTFAFEQTGDPNNPKVYWLDAWAIVKDQSGGNTAQFGWKSSRIHWNDDAVWGYNNEWMEMRYPPGHPYYPQSMDLAFEIRTEQECFPSNDPNYAQWVDAGKPECWCYPRQCHGDGDGLKVGDVKQGFYYVGAGDLTLLQGAWKIKNPPKGPGLSGTQGCADFDHKTAGDAKQGFYRVGAGDLTILQGTWRVKEPPKGPGVPPDCPPGNRVPH